MTRVVRVLRVDTNTVLSPLPLHLSVCNKEGDGKGNKSNGDCGKEGNGDGGKSNGNSNEEGNDEAGKGNGAGN